MDPSASSGQANRMKLAFLNKYQGTVNRGAEIFVEELSKRLAKDFDIDVISNINYWGIFKNKYDFIIPTNGREQVLITRIISWARGTKMIVSGQSGLGADDKWNLLCMPDRFIALTSCQEKWAKKFNPLIKTNVIPNGADLDKFNKKGKPTKVNLPRPIILSVGALVEEKRLDLIISAVHKTKAALLLVGKGNKKEELQTLGNELLPGRFEIKSFSHSEMPEVYRSADLFTYSTVPWESFGNVMVEAMASGLPVVATDDPIRREIVGDAGIFVDPTDTDKYAVSLEKALKTKWGNKPRRQAEKFNWDEIALKYKNLFLELVK